MICSDVVEAMPSRPANSISFECAMNGDTVTLPPLTEKPAVIFQGHILQRIYIERLREFIHRTEILQGTVEQVNVSITLQSCRIRCHVVMQSTVQGQVCIDVARHELGYGHYFSNGVKSEKCFLNIKTFNIVG